MKRCCAFFAFLSFLAFAALFAQGVTGSFTGTVKDSSGAVEFALDEELIAHVAFHVDCLVSSLHHEALHRIFRRLGRRPAADSPSGQRVTQHRPQRRVGATTTRM